MIQKLLPFFATLVARTLRIRWSGDVPRTPCVVMFWHGKMFAGWFIARKLHPVALVSKSKDGEILSSVLRAWRYQLVRGSSKKNGREALEEAIERIRRHEANALAITPDGPKGPRMKYKRGAFIAAQDLNIPLYHLDIRYQKAITLERSWDKFEIPMPFSAVRVTTHAIDCAPYPMNIDDQRRWLDELAERLEATAP